MKLPRSKWARRALFLVLGIAAVYGIDGISLLANIPARPRFTTYTIRRYYYVKENFNKFSYEPRPSVEEQCVNALFPHSGALPCWYLSRHTLQTTAVN